MKRTLGQEGLVHPATRAWFASAFGAPTAVQRLGWPAIARGEDALLVAPTGSGKTLAAFLAVLDRLFRRKSAEAALRVVYVSPLKALGYDIERNLERPLRGIEAEAERSELALAKVSVAVRTGDTPEKERRAFTRRPPEVLITTPESLFILLGSQSARARLETVDTIIIDELHSLAGTKRGAHLAISLERLDALTGRRAQRIGLSATVADIDAARAFLGGVKEGKPRPVTVARDPARKNLELEVIYPPGAGVPAVPGSPGWHALVTRVLDLIATARTTLVFAPSRAVAERLTRAINDVKGEELARAHHGSLSRAARHAVEQRLKAGELRAVVATSSLELGIDVGAVDLVLQVDAIGSVSRLLQRVGRAGHQVGAVARGRVIVRRRPGLIEAAAATGLALRGALEPATTSRRCLDVLAQQIVATVAAAPISDDDLFALVRRAEPFADLSRRAFDDVIAMLAGRFRATPIPELHPRITRDPDGLLRARRGAGLLAISNAGTIPETGPYPVLLADGTRLGELDEQFVFESRRGDAFVLGTGIYRIDAIERDRIVVSPAPDAPEVKLPFWRGEGGERTLEVGREVGALARELEPQLDDRERVATIVRARAPFEDAAVEGLRTHLMEQRQATGALANDRRIIVERTRDDVGGEAIVVHAPFGRRVLVPWSLALAGHVRARSGLNAAVRALDDALVLRVERGVLPEVDVARALDPDHIRRLVAEELANAPVFALRFREAAGRALLLPRRGPGRRTPLWLLRMRAKSLLEVARGLEDFPIVREAYRECLEDRMDLAGLESVLRGLASGEIEARAVATEHPSPLAREALFWLEQENYDEPDRAPGPASGAIVSTDFTSIEEALGRVTARAADGALARELEARELGAHPDRRPRDEDDLEVLLARAGDLSDDEVASFDRAWLAKLVTLGRAARVTWTGELGPRAAWVVPGDAPVFESALGARADVAPDPDTPPPPDPETALERVLARALRARAPRSGHELAERYGTARVSAALERLARARLVERGRLVEGRDDELFSDRDVLARLLRRTLARARAAIEPRAPSRLQTVLVERAFSGARSGSDGVLAIARALAGRALAPAVWEREVFARRVTSYSPRDLDALFAEGALVWRMSGEHVALYPREEWDALAPDAPASEPIDAAQVAVLRALRERGAQFSSELRRAANLDDGALEEALLALARASLVTNDGFHVLRESRGKGPRPLGGRWSVLAPPRPPRDGAEADDRARARARLALGRVIVACRETVRADGAFAWRELAPALDRMELSGEVARGLLVRGLSGIQFAFPEDVRALEPAPAGLPRWDRLAAVDPACAYGGGALAPSPPRRPDVSLVLRDGDPVLLCESFGERLTPLAPFRIDEAARAFQELASILASPAPLRPRARLEVETWDGAPARDAPEKIRAALVKAGFRPSPAGFVLERGP